MRTTLQLLKIQHEAAPLRISAGRHSLICVFIFLVAHAALLIGITTPDKFVFDEVHYVPAARQMLEPVMPSPMLNPMHPPLAKQIIAFSIHVFGDNPLGWRYPGTLFGALAIVAVVTVKALRDHRSKTLRERWQVSFTLFTLVTVSSPLR